MTESVTACACSGMRSCALCADSERVRRLRDGAVPLRSAHEVIARQRDAARTSSCAFACVPASAHSLCIACGRVYASTAPLASCAAHDGGSAYDEALTHALCGLHVLVDVVSSALEDDVLCYLDGVGAAAWTASQSGRRKQEYGPRVNFKERKVRLGAFACLPHALGALLRQMEHAVDAVAPHGDDGSVPFVASELSVLEYAAARASSIDPHVDDTWLWGARIVGANLLADCVMTFVNGDGVAVRVLLPRRCVFVLSGDSRYTWMHGIRAEDVAAPRRISLTARELSDEVRQAMPELATALQRAMHALA